MSSSTASFSLRVRILPPVILLVAVAGLRALEAGIAVAPVRLMPQLSALAGSGGTMAVLGGLRAAVAGSFWLRANLAWERRDAGATTALLHLTVAADERPLLFWLNGARMIAYDMPEWRLGPEASRAVRRRAVVEQAGAALEFLQRGVQWRGPAPDLLIEMANIRLRVLGDREGAARLFRRASEMPGAPYYAARVHGELLRALGRPDEALAWLKKILPGLPADEPAARREVVIQRISELESSLRGQ
ncbi:MAG TPA: hypothetical protein VHN79_05350 [Lacunisphaera sp.]|nr:hypothetical protein [Lacunisphaera sp.]